MTTNPIIKQALMIMESSFKEGTDKINSTQLAKDYARLQIGNEPNEVFGVFFLDNHFRLLAFERLFNGTINETAIHARPLVQRIFHHNAAHVIFTHNHPSGELKPSHADIEMTTKLYRLLRQLDCNVIDHIIVTPAGTTSFNEVGAFAY